MEKTAKKVFDQADVEAEMAKQEAKKGRMNSGGSAIGGAVNKKQVSTMNEVFRIPGSIAASDVETKVRTVITHNKGGFWQPLKAPTTTSKGKVIDCDEEDGCSLNLEIFATQGSHAPVYSS